MLQSRRLNRRFGFIGVLAMLGSTSLATAGALCWVTGADRYCCVSSAVMCGEGEGIWFCQSTAEPVAYRVRTVKLPAPGQNGFATVIVTNAGPCTYMKTKCGSIANDCIADGTESTTCVHNTLQSTPTCVGSSK